ncbi:MAG: helix-turn-helix domain-containing protein [Blastocatellia bacterium]
MMTKLILNTEKYTQLLATAIPVVITSDQDYQRLLKEVEILFDKSMKQALSPEEDTIFELLTTLVHKYEKEHLVEIKSDPVGMLKFFMEQHDKQPKDLWDVIGHKSIVSEILSGTRKININHAKKLAKFFNTSPTHFLDLNS